MIKKIEKKWRILLSSILVTGTLILYNVEPSFAKFLCYISLFIFSILNVYILLRENNRGNLRKNILSILSIYLVQAFFFGFIRYFIELNFAKEIPKMDLYPKEILALRDYTSLAESLVTLFLTWIRYVLYEYIFGDNLDGN